MCLEEVYTDEDMNRIVEELPEVAPGVVEVWKVAFTKSGCFKGGDVTGHFIFTDGLCTAQKIKLGAKNATYFSGFHCFPRRYTALRLHVGAAQAFLFPRSEAAVIKCYLKKEWITATGDGCVSVNKKEKPITRLALVASQAFFPTYPETEARLEDFLAWLKDNEPEYAESQLCEAVK